MHNKNCTKNNCISFIYLPKLLIISVIVGLLSGCMESEINAASRTPDQEVDNILSSQNRYYEREQYFKELDLDRYGIKIVSAPEKDDFINLYILTHKGLPRVGLGIDSKLLEIPDGSNRYHIKNTQDYKIKKALAERVTQDIVSYVQLGNLASKKKLITSKNLKVDESGVADNKKAKAVITNKRVFFNAKGFSPRLEVESIAGRILTPLVYKYYLCDTKGNCKNGYKNRGAGYNGFTWGGRNASEFESRRKYHEFVDKMAPKILHWGSKLSRDVYIVGSARIGEYDFDRKGVPISFMLPAGVDRIKGSTDSRFFKSQQKIFYKARNKSMDIVNNKDSNSGIFQIFKPMNESEGEAFLKRVKKNDKQVFFTLKARFYNYDAKRYGNIFEPLENKINFYMDVQLTDKFFTALYEAGKAVTISASQLQATPKKKSVQAKKSGSGTYNAYNRKDKKNPDYTYISIKSPAPDSLKSIEYRAYKGSYIQARTTLIPALSYHQLLSIKDAGKFLDKEKIKKKFNGKGIILNTPADINDSQWYHFLKGAASTTLTYPAYKKYLCSAEMLKISQCEKNFSSKAGRVAANFGGREASVFERKRALNAYLDNEVDNLLNLASKASYEIFLQRQLKVSSYQFDMGGFFLHGLGLINYIYGPGNNSSPEEKVARDALLKKYPLLQNKRYKKGFRGLLYKMRPDKAEKFAQKLKKAGNRLYYVYKVRLKPHNESYYYKTKTYNVSKMKYNYEIILSTEVEFFFDETMKHKAFSLPVSNPTLTKETES